MYKVIGADQKEYGPVSADELRQWIREGRANAQSRARMEGTSEWRPLNSFAEFSPDLATARPTSSAVFSSTPPSPRTNGMAIAGLVVSLLGLPCCIIGLFSLLGLIFSIVALMQINRNPLQGGKNMAIAGVIISLVTLLLSVLVWLGFLFAGVTQNSSFHF